jgi:divalent metal cation (Fe/Co/Zn/Cd) transporter
MIRQLLTKDLTGLPWHLDSIVIFLIFAVCSLVFYLLGWTVLDAAIASPICATLAYIISEYYLLGQQQSETARIFNE